MNAETILHTDVLDILFENRNKKYGAYQLRKGYDKRLIKAMSLMIALVLFCVVDYIQHHWNNNQSSIASPFLVIDTVTLSPYLVPKTPDPPPVPKPQPAVASITDTPPLIVQDNLVTDKDRMPTVDDLKDKAISNTSSDGNASTTDNQSSTPQGPAAAAVAPQPEPAPEPAVADIAEVMPEFPGGTAALLRFLGKNLQVPEEALEPGQRVRVPVKFVVNRDGNLSNVEFLTQADNVFKKEILRVVAKMPKWKPGSTQGKTVAVYFTIPVIFDMAEN